MTVEPSWTLAIALAALMALTVAISLWSGSGTARENVVAGVRAILQLGVVGLVIAAVIQNVWLSLLFVLFMFCMAVWTTTGRIKARRSMPWAALAIACGLVPTIGLLMLTGLVPWQGVAIIPTCGIVIGNSMTAHTLLGRRDFAALKDEHDELEGYLALGIRPKVAIDDMLRRRMKEALIPSIDQTRTVGLVTLPGAYIGVLLGGGTPLQASAAQVMVLFAVMCAQAVTVAVEHWLITTERITPDPAPAE